MKYRTEMIYIQLMLIRHSLTAGNLENRYIGKRTDVPLCPAGIQLAQEQAALFSDMRPDLVFVSSMQRCRETANILFSGLPQIVHPDLDECDFGQFEGKNYKELSGNTAYQAWIDSGGTLPFPDGESREHFIQRCCRALEQLVQSHSFETAAVVVHGGTCMAVLSELEKSHTPYFDWKIPHCVPFCCQVINKAPLRLSLNTGSDCMPLESAKLKSQKN